MRTVDFQLTLDVSKVSVEFLMGMSHLASIQANKFDGQLSFFSDGTINVKLLLFGEISLKFL